MNLFGNTFGYNQVPGVYDAGRFQDFMRFGYQVPSYVYPQGYYAYTYLNANNVYAPSHPTYYSNYANYANLYQNPIVTSPPINQGVVLPIKQQIRKSSGQIEVSVLEPERRQSSQFSSDKIIFKDFSKYNELEIPCATCPPINVKELDEVTNSIFNDIYRSESSSLNNSIQQNDYTNDTSYINTNNSTYHDTYTNDTSYLNKTNNTIYQDDYDTSYLNKTVNDSNYYTATQTGTDTVNNIYDTYTTSDTTNRTNDYSSDSTSVNTTQKTTENSSSSYYQDYYNLSNVFVNENQQQSTYNQNFQHEQEKVFQDYSQNKDLIDIKRLDHSSSFFEEDNSSEIDEEIQDIINKNMIDDDVLPVNITNIINDTIDMYQRRSRNSEKIPENNANYLYEKEKINVKENINRYSYHTIDDLKFKENQNQNIYSGYRSVGNFNQPNYSNNFKTKENSNLNTQFLDNYDTNVSFAINSVDKQHDDDIKFTSYDALDNLEVERVVDRRSFMSQPGIYKLSDLIF